MSHTPSSREGPMPTVDRLAPPPGAVLVRLRADGPSWLDRLPDVPQGHVVTVSVSDPSLRDVSPRQLLARGYRIVGVHPWQRQPNTLGTVHLLVTAPLIDAYPGWWQELVTHADRAFDLRHGPVQAILGSEIALHLAQ